MKTVVSLLIVFLFISCFPKAQNKTLSIRLKGSDTMYILGEMWAAEYMKKNPDVAVYVEGGGSGTGFEAMINNQADICLASRLINHQEAKLLAEKQKSVGMLFLAAKDALSVYVNYNNPVQDLSIHQLRDIFLGKIINWQEVGGNDELIEVVIRPPTSGTHGYFKKVVLAGQNFDSSAVTIETTAEIARYVAANPSAIGFGGLAYGPSVKHIKIEGTAPIEENVHNESYLLTRYLYVYTAHVPENHIKEFINWLLSPDGQKVVVRVGYIPIWPITQ
ncbi:MAG: phosphate ABC transporter substrate-binding protein [Calditrichaceae bacterium]|nr:phosphate ABC transporter substrate-binding protein [Calditrichaceae bacterium]MBN2709591.1 phosphate ABC transporter substrate-binding protein [Calditrichaceae bacterium]RQV92390.1 MAG: phosphate ABC transporter substrate-binding protein [Calditrichota bacterium]